MLKKLFFITLFFCLPLHANIDTPSAPLQAEPVHAFIDLIGGTRSATPQSSAAKVQALRVFNELYTNGNTSIQELLGNFVEQLTKLVDKKFVMPRTKEKRVIMLMEETKHILSRLQEDATNNGYYSTASANELMEELYTALNPTFGDFWRTVLRVAGISTTIVMSSYFIYILSKISRQFSSVQNGHGMVGQLCTAVTAVQKGQGTLGRLANEIGRATEVSRIEREKWLANHPGQEPPPYFTEQVGNFLEMLTTNLDPTNLQEFCSAPAGLQLVAGIAHMLAESARETNECRRQRKPIPPGTLEKITNILGHMTQKVAIGPRDRLGSEHSFLLHLTYGLSRLFADNAIEDYEDRDKPEAEKRKGTFSRLIRILEHAVDTTWQDGVPAQDAPIVDKLINAIVKITDGSAEGLDKIVLVLQGIIEDLRTRSNTATWLFGSPSEAGSDNAKALAKLKELLQKALK